MSLARNNKIQGYFPITRVDQWDQDELDAEDDPFITFAKERGEFQFVRVFGDMDCE
jgi:hypothetical protein